MESKPQTRQTEEDWLKYFEMMDPIYASGATTVYENIQQNFKFINLSNLYKLSTTDCLLSQ